MHWEKNEREEKPHPDWQQDATGEIRVWGNSRKILTEHAKNMWGWGSWVTRGETWATHGPWRRWNVNGLRVTCQSICCSFLYGLGTAGVVQLDGSPMGHATLPLPAEMDAAGSWAVCVAFSFFLCGHPWLDLRNLMGLPVWVWFFFSKTAKHTKSRTRVQSCSYVKHSEYTNEIVSDFNGSKMSKMGAFECPTQQLG